MKRICIVLDEECIKILKKAAHKKEMSRSEFIRFLIKGLKNGKPE